MTERLFLGSDGGTFKARVSKPGFTARSATQDQCLLHEDTRPLTFSTQGLLTIGDLGSASVSLGTGFSTPPVLVLRCSANRTPAVYGVSGAGRLFGYYAELNLGSGVLTIFNLLGYTDTFKYVVFIA